MLQQDEKTSICSREMRSRMKEIRAISGLPGSSATTCGWAGRRSVAREVPAGTNVGCGIDSMREGSIDLHHDLDSRMFYDLNLTKTKRIITPVLY